MTTATYYFGMAECVASAEDVAAKLNGYSATPYNAETDITLCENGCFNIEGVIVEPGTVPQADTDTRKWFRVGLDAPHYTAKQILDAFPGARDDCPGLAAEDEVEG